MKQNDEVRDMLKIYGEINDAKIERLSYKVDTHLKTIKNDTKWMAHRPRNLMWSSWFYLLYSESFHKFLEKYSW